MIKLFRNTRRKLLSENKFSNYLIYAIGEIFLVVVGILIALWINTKNQESINEAKAVTILKEIQRDLKKDITSSRVVSNNFITHDSIAKLLLWDKLTEYEMFGNPYKTKPFEIVYYAITFKTSNNGYVNFNRNLNSIPTKYDSITYKLKELYDTKVVNLEVANERIKSTVFENLDKVNSYDWNVASIKGSIPEEAKNYYMHDLEFKKHLLKYMNGIKNVFLATESYKLKAIQLHNDISKMLNIDDYIPIFPSFKSSLDSSDKTNILGKYELKETVIEMFPSIIELQEVDNKLCFNSEDYDNCFKYYWHDKTTFLGLFERNKTLTYITFTESKNTAFFISIDKSAYAIYNKVTN